MVLQGTLKRDTTLHSKPSTTSTLITDDITRESFQIILVGLVGLVDEALSARLYSVKKWRNVKRKINANQRKKNTQNH